METIASIKQSYLDDIENAIHMKSKANKTYKTNQIAQAIHDLSPANLKITVACTPGSVIAVQSDDGSYTLRSPCSNEICH